MRWPLRLRRLGAAAFLCLVAACGKDPTDPVPAVLSVSVAPQTVNVAVGGIALLVADVQSQGGASEAVTWSSSNENVATVASDGTIFGLQSGDISVRATSVHDQTKSAEAAVHIFAGTAAGVSIQSLTVAGSSAAADPQAIRDSIDVLLNIAPGDQFVSRVELLIGSTVVASRDYATGSATFSPFDATLRFNSAAYDGQTGVPAFLNAQHALSARVTTPAGLAASNGVALTFENSNALHGIVSTNGATATDAGARGWASGDLTVVIRPVLYSAAGITLTSATVSFAGLQNKVTAGNGLATWQRATAIAAGGSAGYSNNGGLTPIAPTVTATVLSNGAAGPSGSLVNAASVALRLDNRAPQPGVLSLTNQSASTACCSGNWVGNLYSFSSGHTAPPSDGEAVDGSGIAASGVTYHAGSPAQTNEAIAATPAITGVASLAESNLADAYTLVARVADRVGNVALTRLTASQENPATTFGVDKQSPTLTFDEVFSVPHGAINPPAMSVTTIPNDSRSGFSATPVLHRIMGNFGAGVCVHGGSGCSPVPGVTVLNVAPVDGLYFAYEAFARDRAGNASTIISRTALFDAQAPQIIAMPAPAPLLGGQQTQFIASVSDNLDLRSAELRMEFAAFTGPASLPFSPPVQTGQFGTPLVAGSTVAQSIPFVRSLELTTGAGAPAGNLQATIGHRFRVLDEGGNLFAQSANLNSVPAGTGASALGIQTFRMTTPASATLLCAGNNCGSNPTTVVITAEAAGLAGSFNVPFARVYFYWIDATGLTRLIGSSAAPSGDEMGGTRRWSWTVNFSAPGAPTQGSVQLFAIGVDGSGDALRAPINTLLSIVNQ